MKLSRKILEKSWNRSSEETLKPQMKNESGRIHLHWPRKGYNTGSRRNYGASVTYQSVFLITPYLTIQSSQQLLDKVWPVFV